VGIALLPASLLAGWLWQAVSPDAAFVVGSSFAVAVIASFQVFDDWRLK
jgi:hypothetical protein